MNTRRQFVRSTLQGAATAALATPTLLAKPLSALAAPPTTASLLPDGVAPRGAIDWHNHWLSPRSVDILKKRTSAPQLVSTPEGQLAFVTGLGAFRQPLVLAREFTDVEARLQHLDTAGIDRQVISWPTTLGTDALLTAREAKPLWSAYNEDLGNLVKKYPRRFSGLAALPTSDIPWAARELERAHRDLGLIGAVLPVGAFQTIEGAKRLTPIFEVAQKYGSHIYLHTGPASPGIPGQQVYDSASNDAPAIRAELERSASFTNAVITLTNTTFLEPFPNVTVQIAMLGGAAAVLAAWQERYPRGEAGPNPAKLLRRLYFDTGVYGRSPHLAEFTAQIVGADRVLFGSDFPLATIDKTTAIINRSAFLSAADKQLLFVENGRGLLENRNKLAAK